MDYVLSSDPKDPRRDAVLTELRISNRIANPEGYRAYDDPANAARDLHLYALDGEGRVAGGLFGTTQLKWLKIEILAVRADLRRRGIGRELLRRAEAEALTRGCVHVFLDTMEYQARGMYEKCGYTVSGEIPDWDSHGHAKFFMTKRLAVP